MAVAYWVCYITLLATITVNGFPSGAPSFACKSGTNLMPLHGSSVSQSTKPPYVVNTSFIGQSYIPGQLYNLTLTAEPGSSFAGFMIEGQAVADNSPVGIWLEAVNAQAVCSERTAATHTNNVKKQFINLWWRAPPAETGAIRFRYAFVSSFSVYWAGLFTKIIDEKVNQGTLTSTQLTTTAVIATLTTSTSTKIFPSSTSTVSSSMNKTFSTAILTSTSTGNFSTTVSSSSMRTFSTALLTSTSTRNFSTSGTGHTSSQDPHTSSTSDLASIFSTSSLLTTSSIVLTSTPIVSCDNVTGYPLCSPDYCTDLRSKYARCSARVSSCSNKCQITTCRACIYVENSEDVVMPEECAQERCTELRCVVRWIKCAYKKISKFQMKRRDRKPENFQCFVPNCYYNY